MFLVWGIRSPTLCKISHTLHYRLPSMQRIDYIFVLFNLGHKIFISFYWFLQFEDSLSQRFHIWFINKHPSFTNCHTGSSTKNYCIGSLKCYYHHYKHLFIECYWHNSYLLICLYVSCLLNFLIVILCSLDLLLKY